MIIVTCFANGLYILDVTYEEPEYNWTAWDGPNLQPCLSSEGKIIEDITGWGIADAIINQYLLALGEFSIDNFEDNKYNKMIWTMFILATFFSNILFLNMIIAIMGDTYSRVSGDWHRSALIERTNIYADYMPWIKISKKFENQRFLYVVTPINEEIEHEFHGAVSKISDLIKKNHSKLTEQ